MGTYKGTATLDPATGAFSFVPETAVSPAPPPSPPGWTFGQPPFKTSSLWNTPVRIGAIYTGLAWPAPHLWQTSPPGATNYGAAWDSYSPAVYVAAAGDPIVKVSHPATWGRPAGTESIRMPAAAVGAQGTDQELVVIDGDTVHSFWQFKRVAGALVASCSGWAKCSVSVDDGFGWPGGLGAGTVAIGSSLFAGLLVKAETDLGAINHALGLRMGVPLLNGGFVPPAINSDAGNKSTGIVQEGQRLAIALTAPAPGGLSPLGLQVFKCMQVYGCFVNDQTNDDQWGGSNGPRVQANAYDDPTITALNTDLIKLIPMLKKVS